MKTGWGNPDPYSSRSKFHYFGEDGRSACGRWGNPFGQITLEQGNDNHPDNCATCKRKLSQTHTRAAQAFPQEGPTA